MATQLFFRDTTADTHRGTNTAKRNGVASGWLAKALATTRGPGVVASGNTATVTGATNGIEVSNAAAVPFEWLSPPVSADVTISGTITANIWASESNMSANVAINVIIDIVRSATSGADASNTIQNIVQSTYAAAELAVTTRAANNFTAGMTSGGYTGQTLNRGDRLRIRIIGDDFGTMATGFTFNASWSGTGAAADGDTYVTFTENFSFESAPGVMSFARTSDGFLGQAVTNERRGSGFTASGDSLTAVSAWLAKGGTPTDNLVVELQTDSSGSPSGSVVGTIATVGGASLTTTATQTTWSGLSIALTPGSTYWIVMRRSTAVDVANYYIVGTGLGGTPWAEVTSLIYNTGSWITVTSESALSITQSTSVLYLTNTASDVATASVDREAWTSRGAGVQTDVRNTAAGWTAPLQLTDTAGGTVVDWFTKQLTAFTLTGMAVGNLRLHSSIANNVSARCELARVDTDGTNATVWASWLIGVFDDGTVTNTQAAYTVNVSGDDLAFTNGQRLRIRIYVDDSSDEALLAAHTLTLSYAGTSAAASGDTYITLPQSISEYVTATAGSALQTYRQRRAHRFLTTR